MIELVLLLSPFFLRQWRRLLFFALLTPIVFAIDLTLLTCGSQFLNGNFSVQNVVFLMVGFLFVEGLRSFQGFLLCTLTARIGLSLQNKLIEKILRAPYSVYSTMTSGGKSKRILRDANQVASFTESLTSLFLREPFRVLLFSAILLYWSPFLFLILTASLLFVGFFSWFMGKKLAVIYEVINNQESVFFQKLQKLLLNWNLVKTAKMEEAESVSWNNTTEKYYQQLSKAALLTLMHPIIFRFFVVLAAGILWWFYAAGELSLFKTPADWIKVIGVMLLWVHSVKSLAGFCLGLVDEGIRAKQLAEILKWPQENPGKDFSKTKIPLKEIALKNIYFNYERKREFYNGLTFNLKSGDVAVVSGPNGSGKTTLSYLLICFLQPLAGEIQFNGKNADAVSLAWLRERTGVVFQHPQFLETTLCGNLYYGLNGQPRSEAQETLEKVGLNHLVEWLHEGKLLGETVRDLSFGEKQKLALARAFLQQPDFLILDEATSGLDLESEEKILKELFASRKDKITLFITHKWRFPDIPVMRVVLGAPNAN